MHLLLLLGLNAQTNRRWFLFDRCGDSLGRLRLHHHSRLLELHVRVVVLGWGKFLLLLVAVVLGGDGLVLVLLDLKLGRRDLRRTLFDLQVFLLHTMLLNLLVRRLLGLLLLLLLTGLHLLLKESKLVLVLGRTDLRLLLLGSI